MQYRKILVIKWGAVGDFIAGTIALTALREAFPTAAITLLSKEANRPICPPGTLINDFWAMEDFKKSRSPYLLLLRRIRGAHFDLVVNLRWNSEAMAILTALSGAKMTAGISKSWTRHLYKRTVTDIEDFDNRHEYLKNTDPLRAIGMNVPFPKAYVHIRDKDRLQAAEIVRPFAGSEVVIFCPTASNPKKAWPPERYAALGHAIVKEYAATILVSWAGKQEQEVAAGITAGIGAGAHLLPPLSIGELAALMQRSRLCICNNSGALHIAFAAGTPVICFNTSKGWEPYGPNATALSVFREEPGFNLTYTTNEMAEEQLARISAEEAFTAFRQKWAALSVIE